MKTHESEDAYFESTIRGYPYELGLKSPANRVFEDMYKLSPATAVDVVTTVFRRNFEKEKWNIIEGILHMLSEERFEEAFPISDEAVKKCINVDRPMVQELSLRCIENWENPGFIETLKNFKSSESWLRDDAKEILREAERNWQEK